MRKLRLQNFRNHSDSTIECAPRINVFVGENGAGKTNIVEGIAYLSLTKSFYASQDAIVLQEEKPWFRVQGELESSRGIGFAAEVRYDGEAGGKEYVLNKTTVERLASVIGQFPVVVLSPEQHGITFGLPSERRKFLDGVLSQSSSMYFEDLLQYRRSVRQRNRILLEAKLAQADPGEQLLPWNDAVASLGVRVALRREEFVSELREHLVTAYDALVDSHEKPAIEYVPSVRLTPGARKEDAVGEFKEAMKRRARDERRFGSSLVGPHRDELRFSIDGLDIRKFASQGQHKTFLIALKLAEHAFLRGQTEEEPMMIFDDVFSELDANRTAKLVDRMRSMKQVFVTATSDSAFWQGFESEEENIRVEVKKGKVLRASTKVPTGENA